MKKFVLGGGALLVLALGVGIFYTMSNLDRLVAGAIEKHGSDVTQTRVGVGGVEISVREGRGSIRGLTIASPEGFDSSNAFSLGDITLDIDLGSVRQDPIVIDEILIRSPQVTAVFKSDGTSNIDKLRKQIQNHVPAGAGGAEDQESDPVKLRIRKLTFEAGTIGVDASALGLDERSLDLGDIQMNDIGGANGATADEIATIILTRLAKDAAQDIARSEVRRQIEDNLGDAAKGLLDRLRN
jgi:hypothetical protein